MTKCTMYPGLDPVTGKGKGKYAENEWNLN